MPMCRLFFEAALSQFKETANNVVFFAYKKHLTCIVSYLFVWYHSFIILMEGILTQCQVLLHKLEKQNTAIYEREQLLASVEKELVGARGIFKAKQRKELQEQAEQLKTQIANMKQYLSSIVQGYGYKNVKEFLAEYRASKVEYTDYQSAVAKWEQQTGNKAESDSMKARLQRKQQEVQERENNRQSHHHKKDRGGR